MLANFFTKKVMNACVHEDYKEGAFDLQKTFKEDCNGRTLLLDTPHPSENVTIMSSTAGYEITDSNLQDLQFFLGIEAIDKLEEVDVMDTVEEADSMDTLQIGGINNVQSTQYGKHSGKTTDSPVNEILTMFSAQFQLSSESATEEPQVCVNYNENEVKERHGNASSDSKICSGLLLEASDEAPLSSSPTKCTTSKLRSALRGGHVMAGLGPRPKLNVKWAPDVYEPLCTSTSHTVPPHSHGHRRSHHHQKSSSSKGLQKGKSSRSNSNKKAEKKLSRKLRQGHNESHMLRLPAYVSQLGMRSGGLYSLSRALDSHVDEPAVKSVTLNPLVLPQKGWPLSQVLQLHDPKLAARVPPWTIQTRSLCA